MIRGRDEDEATERLLEACRERDVAALRRAIQDGGDVNAREDGDELDEDGWSEQEMPALSFAAMPSYGESLDCLSLLIEHGADVHAMDKQGTTPLMRLCLEEGDVEIAEALLNAPGADPSFPMYGEEPGNGALFFAVYWASSLPLTKLFLARGVDVNATTSVNGKRILMDAAETESPSTIPILEALLAAGADVNAVTTQHGDTPAGRHALYYCLLQESFELLLAHGADPRLKFRGKTAAQDCRDSLTFDLTYPESDLWNWTPWKMLPRFEPSARVFAMYGDHCPGFVAAVRTLLLVLNRYRLQFPPGLVLECVQYVGDMHKTDQWWPIVDFSMDPFM
jgi:ankyrin repeat protein